ncbi:hypothetical protein LBW89_27050 [Paenibacillus sp. alder61]|uniref:hypothetical protein n=1 Tax=Paenibacillus sp. alder61 TaxID=2862948 RepID=UPI001CD4BBA3|nr:hypothetical protein [Paenibacillus sp. alder61]MCA1296673.1 hypothetical protein [Paenibacillus sp. alder61]
MRVLWGKTNVPDYGKPEHKRRILKRKPKLGIWTGKRGKVRHSLKRKFIRLKLQVGQLNGNVSELNVRVNTLQTQVSQLAAQTAAKSQPPSPPAQAPGTGAGTGAGTTTGGNAVQHTGKTNDSLTRGGGGAQDSLENANARITALHQLVDGILRQVNSQQRQIDDAFSNINALRQQVQQYTGPEEEYEGLITLLTPLLNTSVTIDTAAGPIFGTLVAIGLDYIEIVEPDGSIVLIPFDQVLSVS